jgi:rfaE bifunctional protein kinase chain/domain
VIKNIITKVNELSIPIFVDPKGTSWGKYTNATCLTPNIGEVENELKININTDEDFEAAASILKKKYSLQSCLITRGAEGMTYYSKERIIHQKVGEKKVFDVSGAGDTVISCFAASLCANLNLDNSVELSSFVASEVVSYIGTKPFHKDMIINE